MKTKVAIAVLMAMASGAAWSAESGVYLGASFGWSEVTSNTTVKYSDSQDGVYGSEKSDFSGSDFAYNIFLGYNFNKYAGVEIGYIDLGEPSDTYRIEDEGTYKEEVDVELHGMDLAVIARYPFANDFDVHGKLGVIWWTPKITDKLTDVDYGYWDKVTVEQDATDLLYGVGVAYTYDERLVLSLDWQNFELGGVGDFIGGNTSAWMFGAAWKF